MYPGMAILVLAGLKSRDFYASQKHGFCSDYHSFKIHQARKNHRSR